MATRSAISTKTLAPDLDHLDAERASGRYWERLKKIPDGNMWAAHLEQKLDLAFFARGRLRLQFARHGEPPDELARLDEVLDPNVMTIGFARRFATYKRASLLFTDEERLARLLWDHGPPACRSCSRARHIRPTVPASA